MPKRLPESLIEDDQKSSKVHDVGNLFFEEAISDNEDVDELSMDEQEWEEVPLDGTLSLTISKYEPRKEVLTGKRRAHRPHKYQKLKYGLHISSIQIYLIVLRHRSTWIRDRRLNRRLKSTVPELITKKFKRWKSKSQADKLHCARTLILGLVWWFRKHYQINSNGFRQNFNRLQYLIKYADKDDHDEFYEKVLNNQQWFYGSRPEGTDDMEHIREMARDKKANRDILVIFFLIILQNMVSEKKEISLCFALPLHDYEISCSNVKHQMLSGMARVPNKFDSDLLQPFFWIEMRFPGLDKSGLYVIDPIVHLKDNDIVRRYEIGDSINIYLPLLDMKLNLNQRFQYVVSIDCQNGIMRDVSPRYLPNKCYRYFNLNPSSLVCKSMNYKAYQALQESLKKFNGGRVDDRNNELMRSISMKNWEIPKTLKEMKRSDCFILKSILKVNEAIESNSQPVEAPSGRNYFREPIYWKCDVIDLKCEVRWNQLGRSLIKDSKPLKLKRHVTMKNRRDKQFALYEIRELFSFNQTISTPKLSNYATDKFGRQYRITDVEDLRNEHGNIELYSPESKPDGFELLPLKHHTKKLIQRYNRSSRKAKYIKYIDVVSGFDFKQKSGYAVPQVDHILLNSEDYLLTQELIRESQELEGLNHWKDLLIKLCIKSKLNDRYGPEQR